MNERAVGGGDGNVLCPEGVGRGLKECLRVEGGQLCPAKPIERGPCSCHLKLFIAAAAPVWTDTWASHAT